MKYEIEIRNPLTGEFVDVLEGDTDTLTGEQQIAWFGRAMPKTPRRKDVNYTPRKRGKKYNVGGHTPTPIGELAAFYQNPENEGKSFWGDD